MKLPLLKNVVLVLLLSLFSLNCGTNGNKQQYLDEYTSVINEFMSRNDIIKKGEDAVIAYRRSNFTDIDNAENAKNSFIQSIKLDSAALVHLSKINSPGPAEKEMTSLLYAGIESISKGTTIFASNYSKAKDQNFEQRKETLMNVRPPLTYLAKGFNSLVISLKNVQEYIKENNLDENENLSASLKYFQGQRDNLKSFIRE